MKRKTIKEIQEAPLGKFVRIKETDAKGRVTEVAVSDAEAVTLCVRVPKDDGFSNQYVSPRDCEPYVERRIGFVGPTE